MSNHVCSIPICKGKGQVQKFKYQGVNTLIQRSISRADDFHHELRALLLEFGDDVSIHAHKSCYLSYTSKKS